MYHNDKETDEFKQLHKWLSS